MNKISVSRHNFFTTKKGTLRFSEHSPKRKECEHQLCGCTRNVTKRPSGKPSQVSEGAVFEIGNLKVNVGLRSQGRPIDNSVDFTFVLSKLTGKPIDPAYIGRPHAYFWFQSSVRYSESIQPLDSLMVEITKPGYGLVDHFFGHVYRGNKVDISDFFNGHSPSEVVKLDQLGPNDIWCHECAMGAEAMSVFSPHDSETSSWKAAFDNAEWIHQRILAVDPTNLNSARRKLVNDRDLNAAISLSQTWLSTVVKCLDETDLFAKCDRVRKEAELLESKRRKARQREAQG